MVVYGLTGGVGMGKTTAARQLECRGVRVTDTDIIAREVVEPGTEGLLAVVNRFGPGILKADGSLDRAKLAAVVFEKESLRQDLETLLHPRIRAAWQARLEAWRNEGCERAVVVIPLLFETGAEQTGRELPPSRRAEEFEGRKRGLTNKRVLNARLKEALGYEFRHPTYREGYARELAGVVDKK